MGKTCVLVLGGQIQDPSAFLDSVKTADYILAADSGARHLLALGQIPHGIMGDLDSIGTQQLQKLQEAGCRVHRYPAEKDETDSCLVLKEAAMMGFENIQIWGALGNRIDHTFANIMLLLLTDIGPQQSVVLKDGGLAVFLPKHGQTLTGQSGDYVSLFALGEPVRGFRNRGLKYQPPGDRYDMNFPLGISNELVDTEAWIDWDEGILLCMMLNREKFGGSGHERII